MCSPFSDVDFMLFFFFYLSMLVNSARHIGFIAVARMPARAQARLAAAAAANDIRVCVCVRARSDRVHMCNSNSRQVKPVHFKRASGTFNIPQI